MTPEQGINLYTHPLKKKFFTKYPMYLSIRLLLFIFLAAGIGCILPTEAQHKKKKGQTFDKTRRISRRLASSRSSKKEIRQSQYATFRGDIPMHAQKQGNPTSTFLGPVPVSSQGNNELISLQLSRYRGSIPMPDQGQVQAVALQLSRFKGEVVYSPSYVKKQYEKKAGEIAGFTGVKVYSPQYKKRRYEDMSKEMKKFTGGPVSAKRKRDKRIPATNTDKNAEVPAYDSREPEIWVKPRNSDGSESSYSDGKGFFGKLAGIFRKKPKTYKSGKHKRNQTSQPSDIPGNSKPLTSPAQEKKE
jgi:hypothetical protein